MSEKKQGDLSRRFIGVLVILLVTTIVVGVLVSAALRGTSKASVSPESMTD